MITQIIRQMHYPHVRMVTTDRNTHHLAVVFELPNYAWYL